MKSAAPNKTNIIMVGAIFIHNFPIGWQQLNHKKALARTSIHLLRLATAKVFVCAVWAFLWLDEMRFVAQFFDGVVETGAFGFAGGLPISHDQIFETCEFFVQTGILDWRSEIRDQLCV